MGGRVVVGGAATVTEVLQRGGVNRGRDRGVAPLVERRLSVSRCTGAARGVVGQMRVGD
ncbi:UNVERIFIED_CONTAM: hypothetical protein Sradi_4874900 [Sesamum radiatum]|uniref:Uncharacterized protein n=1 Tax=Sesamum radiatum TaxID=300843 RepID=A0AAW2MYN9_SESRA